MFRASEQKLQGFGGGGKRGENNTAWVTTPWNRREATARNERGGKLNFDSETGGGQRAAGTAKEHPILATNTPLEHSPSPQPHESRSGQCQPQWVGAALLDVSKDVERLHIGTSQPQLIIPYGEENRKRIREKPWSSI